APPGPAPDTPTPAPATAPSRHIPPGRGDRAGGRGARWPPPDALAAPRARPSGSPPTAAPAGRRSVRPGPGPPGPTPSPPPRRLWPARGVLAGSGDRVRTTTRQ